MASMTARTSIQVSLETHGLLKEMRRIKGDGDQESIEEVILRLIALSGLPKVAA